MTGPNNEHSQRTDALLQGLEDNLDSLEREMRTMKDEILSQRRSLWGHPEVGQAGVLEEREKRISRLEEEIKNTRTVCEGLRDERREEMAERRGREKAMNRVLSFIGGSSLLTFLTMIGLIIAILSGTGITGGP
jgi:predicted RNase H-like nuclease (RuvC/YqgF family)